MQCVNMTGCQSWFHGTHSGPWWKWRNATGYLNIRGRARNNPSLYPRMHLCKLIFYSSHMPTPQDHSCLHEQDSEISLLHSPELKWAFVGWHGTNCSRSPLLNIGYVPWEILQDRRQSSNEAICCSKNKTGGRISVWKVLLLVYYTEHTSLACAPAYVTSSPFG